MSDEHEDTDSRKKTLGTKTLGEVADEVQAAKDAWKAKAEAHIAEAAERDREALQAIVKGEPKLEVIEGGVKPDEGMARAFRWRDPATIPPRRWIYGHHLIRRFMSATIAPPGVGKSSLAIAEALAMVSGKDLLGTSPRRRYRAWYWNGEDPLEEIERRVMATAVYYGLDPEDLDGLFLGSGREAEIVIATQSLREGVTVAKPVVDKVRATILANAIDVVIIDPFLTCHRVQENDNGAIDRVAKTWAHIAEERNVAVELVHHSRKTYGAEVSVEDSRGASALLGAARSARVLNVMTKEEAERAEVKHRRLHVRIDDGKANLAPPPDGATWFRLDGQDLGNADDEEPSDNVGVAVSWTWPDAFSDITTHDLSAAQRAVGEEVQWRESPQSKEWVGIPIAEALELDLDLERDRQKVRTILRRWIENGMFKVVEGRDRKGNIRKYVIVGEWA